MISSFNLLKSNLLKQMRSYKFMVVILIAMVLAYFCVPSAGSGFEVFHFGGVRGVYNSAWIGAMCAFLPTILLWLPAFYLLRSQISEDENLKLGQVIAASPISKMRYITGKAVSNFAVLLVLQLIFSVSLVLMQLARGESMQIVFMDYVKPILFITMPYLIFLASLTVLFDVIPIIRGAFGNVLIFVVWIIFSVLTIEKQGSTLDLFAIGELLEQMTNGAQAAYPNLPSEVGSFGFTIVSKESATFLWSGLEWDAPFIASRLIWLGVSVVIVVISSIIFNRFKGKSYANVKIPVVQNLDGTHSTREFGSIKELSPVSSSSKPNLFLMVKGDLKNMAFGKSLWWYLAVISAIIITFVFPMNSSYKWMSLTMLLLISILSEMGCMEKIHNTSEIVFSSSSRPIRWLSNWIAGIIVTLTVSIGIIAKLALSGLWGNLIAWVVGCVFIATLAQTLGSISGVRKAFEACYIMLFFIGPIYKVPNMDFLGLSSINTGFTLIITVALFVIGYGYIMLKESMNRDVNKENLL